MTDTDTPTAEAIVADAQRALDDINERITRLRANKIGIGNQIRDLLVERKPLMRIVTAAHGRKSASNGDTE
jgi:hypothetical protein